MVICLNLWKELKVIKFDCYFSFQKFVEGEFKRHRRLNKHSSTFGGLPAWSWMILNRYVWFCAIYHFEYFFVTLTCDIILTPEFCCVGSGGWDTSMWYTRWPMFFYESFALKIISGIINYSVSRKEDIERQNLHLDWMKFLGANKFDIAYVLIYKTYRKRKLPECVWLI